MGNLFGAAARLSCGWQLPSHSTLSLEPSALYAALEEHTTSASRPTLPVPPLPALRPTLKPHQCDAVGWMLGRERAGTRAAVPGVECTWRSVRCADGHTELHWNACSGALATQLPPLVTQIAGALAPFAAPGGGVNGVCGLFLDGASQINPSLVGTAGNTEEAREARDLEKIFVAHAHGVAANNLAGVLVADPRLRECFLETLAAAASAHPSAMSRKSALQALIRVAQCWLPTAEVVASGGATRAGEGPVPGFAAFAVSRVAKEACVDAVMRGDLDPRDAGCAAAVAETVNFTRVMLERLGHEFANHLRVNLLGAAWGLDPESHGREYVRRVTSTTQNSAREARAFIAECAKIAQGKNPGVASKKCTPGM